MRGAIFQFGKLVNHSYLATEIIETRDLLLSILLHKFVRHNHAVRLPWVFSVGRICG
jgi:hypothetical protein